MTIFIDYIYKHIIDLIISHITNNNDNNDNNNRSLNQNEIINYSLVSKYFYKSTQESLSNNLKYNNYNKLKPFINTSDNSNNDNQNNNNYTNNYKLINKQNFKIFNSLQEYNDNKMVYDKCIISINDIEEFSKSLPKTNLNSNDYEIDINNISIDPELNNHLPIIESIQSLIKNKVNRLQIQDTDFENEDSPFDSIVKLLPKSIIYSPNDYYCQDSYSHLDYSQLFKLESLEELIIKSSDHVEIGSINQINNQSTRLKSVTIPILFHDICFDLYGEHPPENGCDYHYGGLYHSKNNIVNQFDEFVEVLSKNKTIKQLRLNNFCNSLHCILNIDSTPINSYFKSIFQNNNTIESLSLQYLNFIDSTFIDGLAQNTSIRDLSVYLFYYYDKSILKENGTNDLIISNIFQNLLPKNNNIRNLTITCFTLESLINILNQQQQQQQINLYSLSVEINLLSFSESKESKDKEVRSFFDQINNIKYLNIYQINIYYSHSNTQYCIINNNIFKYLNKLH